MENEKELIKKMQELKESNEMHMVQQMDSMIRANIETNRAKCLEMAITSLKVEGLVVEYAEAEERAEKYYKWICGI